MESSIAKLGLMNSLYFPGALVLLFWFFFFFFLNFVCVLLVDLDSGKSIDSIIFSTLLVLYFSSKPEWGKRQTYIKEIHGTTTPSPFPKKPGEKCTHLQSGQHILSCAFTPIVQMLMLEPFQLLIEKQ